MSAAIDASMMRVYISEEDQYDGRPLYQVIVELAHERRLRGATVLRGVEGFGMHSPIHTSRVFRLAQHLPLVIEVCDTDDRIDPFVEQLQGILTAGAITIERVRLYTFHAGKN